MKRNKFIIFVILLCLFSNYLFAGKMWVPQESFGVPGSGDGEFNDATYLTMVTETITGVGSSSTEEKLVIADSGNKRVQILKMVPMIFDKKVVNNILTSSFAASADAKGFFFLGFPEISDVNLYTFKRYDFTTGSLINDYKTNDSILNNLTKTIKMFNNYVYVLNDKTINYFQYNPDLAAFGTAQTFSFPGLPNIFIKDVYATSDFIYVLSIEDGKSFVYKFTFHQGWTSQELTASETVQINGICNSIYVAQDGVIYVVGTNSIVYSIKDSVVDGNLFVQDARSCYVYGNAMYVLTKNSVSYLTQQDFFNVKGRIIDSSGNPVPGVTVQVFDGSKSLNKWVMTDLNGEYSVSLLANESHIISPMNPEKFNIPEVRYDDLSEDKLDANFVMLTTTNTITTTNKKILTKPNPYNPSKDGVLEFYGADLVPNNTKIEILTINGEHIRTLESKSGENTISWDGKNDNGNQVISGTYLYTYNSSKKSNVGKFTILNKGV